MSKPADIKKQIEYYLGDANLSKDDFFRDKILEDKADGYIQLDIFQKCNAIKKMSITIDDIAKACKDSKDLELSKDLKKIRRTGNKALPEKTGSLKKRDAKASTKKEESKVEEPEEDIPIVRDE